MVENDIKRMQQFPFTNKQLSSIMFLRCKGFFKFESPVKEKIDNFFHNF